MAYTFGRMDLRKEKNCWAIAGGRVE